MNTSETMSNLVEEYKAILEKVASVSSGPLSNQPEAVARLLIAEGEWTPKAAEHLICLSKDYGSFMLRNALALALALEIEDGTLGF